jgi:ankyrin repeat protein
VQTLLEYGIDKDLDIDFGVDGGPICALMVSSELGHDKVVSLLLHKAPLLFSNRPTHIPRAVVGASKKGHGKIVQMLLAFQEQKVWPPKGSNYSFEETIQESLRSACKNGHVDVVQVLLSEEMLRRIEIPLAIDSPLLEACKNGYEVIVQLLLKAVTNHNNKYQGTERRIIYVASKGGAEGIVQQFLNHDLKVHRPDRYQGPPAIKTAKRRRL